MHFDPNTIEQTCKLLDKFISGAKITNMLENLRIRPANDIEGFTKWKRLFNAISSSQNEGNQDSLIKVVEYILSPVNFHNKSTLEYQEAIKELNVILLLHGLKLEESGKVVFSDIASSLSEAQSRAIGLKKALEPFNIHPQILNFCRAEILTDNYFHLVFEATKCVLSELRAISHLTLDGNKLINECFDGKNPLILMNRFETTDDRNEHAGLKSLLNLLVHWYRNPKAHKPKYFSSDSKENAVEALILISKARWMLENCFLNPTRNFSD